MNSHYNQTEIIDKYLSNELNEDEQKWFEHELTSNPDFAHEVLLHKNINKAILENDIINLRSQLQTIETQTLNKRSFINEFFHFKWQYIAVAASITVLLSFGLRFMTQSNLTNDELYNMYYQTYDGEGAVRSANEKTDQELSQAMRFYNDKKYDEALVLFNSILDKDYSNVAVHLYAGIANMECFKYNEAVSSFQLIIDHHRNLYVDQANWYLAICYLKMYQDDKARQLLKKIVEEDGSFKKQARDILKKM
jgi:tetratricopeptide (TPR) repeat protein